jgi:acetyltransferase
MSTHSLEKILHPQSIAIAGASSNPTAYGYHFTRHLFDYGYRGKIYLVNPNYPEILGLKAYPRLRDIPESINYVICCIPASGVPELLEDCSQKGVRAVHLLTARLSETGRPDAIKLEREILRLARKRGIRLIGPNGMGIYYPKEGLSFGYDFPKEPGTVGALFQSGGASMEFIRSASLRGIRFSKVISYGNALDYNESDFLDYFSEDSETKIILNYIEGVKDGKRFFNALRNAASNKPTIIIKGGRGKSRMRTVASHTAALAGSMKTWETLITQSGSIPARNLDEMIDLAVSFQFLPVITGPRVGITGGSGGTSVLLADECEEGGLDVIPLPPEFREEVKNKAPSIGDWLGNPADISIAEEAGLPTGDILQMMSRNEDFDLLITNIGDDSPWGEAELTNHLKREVDSCLKVKRRNPKPLLVILREKSLAVESHNNWRWKLLTELKTQLATANIPVYPSVSRAVRAVKRLIDYYQIKDETTTSQ